MITVKVKIEGCDFTYQSPLVTSGTVGKVKLEFSFSPEWNSLAKTAVFHTMRGDILVPVFDNKCTVPFEALEKSGKLMFGVFGTDGEETITTVFHSIDVAYGVPTSGEGAGNYSPSLYEEFSARFAKFENMTAVATEGEEASATILENEGGALLSLVLPRGADGEKGEKGEKGEPGKDGYTPIRGVDYLTKEETKKFLRVGNHSLVGGILNFDSKAEFEEYIYQSEEYLNSVFYEWGTNLLAFINGVPSYVYRCECGDVIPFKAAMLDEEKTEIEERFGDVESALDSIIEIKNSLIGGDVE